MKKYFLIFAFALSAFGDRLNINTGSTANDRTGDGLITALQKANTNFMELYSKTTTNAEGTAFATTGTTKIRSLADRAADVVNVKDYATGDGVTDDYSGIVAAYTAAQSKGFGLSFPDGVYAFSQPLKFNQSGTYFSGSGAATLLYTGDYCTNSVAFEGENPANFIYRVRVEGVNFVGNAHCTNVVSMTSCAHVVMKNVRIFNCIDAGLYLKTNVLGQFDSVSVSANELPSFVFTNAPYAGFKIQGCNSLTWNNVMAEGVTGPGLLLTDHAINNVFIAGTSEGNGYGIILTNFSNENTFFNMDIEENAATYNVYVLSSWRNRFINGEYDAQKNGSPPTGGIYVSNSYNTQISASVASIYLDVGANNSDVQGSMIQNGGSITDLGSYNQIYNTISTLTLLPITNKFNSTQAKNLNVLNAFTAGTPTGTVTDMADIYGPLGIIGAAGSSRDFYFGSDNTGAGLRWIIRATGDAEVGSDGGSDLIIQSRTDTGGLKSEIVRISRINGTVNIPSLLNGYVLFPGNGGAISQDTNFFWRVANHSLGIGTSIPDDKLDVYGNIGIIGNSQASRDFYFGTSNTVAGLRWMFRCNSDVESGGDSGSNLQIISRTDSGGLKSAVMTVIRSTGAISFPGSLSTTNISSTGIVAAQNGFSSTSVNVGMPVTPTGATNLTGVNQTAWLTAATGLQVFDNAGTALWSSTQAIAALTSITVQPGGKFTGTGITTVGAGGNSHGF